MKRGVKGAAPTNLSIFSKPFVVYLCKYTILLCPLDLYWFMYYYMYIIKYKSKEATVITLTLYLKDHNRMPIRFGTSLPFRDIQAGLPRGWCSRCGTEVFQEGQDLCIHCRNAKGANHHAT